MSASAIERADRTVLVIGGAGYVGNVLVRHLLAEGYSVRVLDALIYGHGTAIAPLFEHPRFSFVRGDLRDPEAVGRCLEGATDAVLLAGLVGDPICKKHPEIAREVNVDGPVGLTGLLGRSGVERLVFTSTCSNYGLRTSDEPADETSELAPVSLYAENKVELEQHLLGPAAGLGFDPTILRIATAYGLSPRMRFDLTISEFTRTMAIGEDLLVYDADTWRPYCHVDDISLAISTVLEAPKEKVAGEIFNVGHSDENYTKRMVVEVVQEHLGGAGTVTYQEGGTDPRNYRVSFGKIADVLGFAPRRRVPEAVGNLIAAVQAGAFGDTEERPGFYGNRQVELPEPLTSRSG